MIQNIVLEKFTKLSFLPYTQLESLHPKRIPLCFVFSILSTYSNFSYVNNFQNTDYFGLYTIDFTSNKNSNKFQNSKFKQKQRFKHPHHNPLDNGTLNYKEQ